MTNPFYIAKRYYNKLRGAFPSPLPVGVTEFQSWADTIIDTYTLPTQDRDSVHYALATMILHLGPTVAYKSNWYFVLSIHSACAKQVAGATFQDIKIRQQQAAAKPTVVTVTDTGTTSDVQKQ